MMNVRTVLMFGSVADARQNRKLTPRMALVPGVSAGHNAFTWLYTMPVAVDSTYVEELREWLFTDPG